VQRFLTNFFVEFLVELNVTSTGCVAFCCLLHIALCCVVLCCAVVMLCVVICLLLVTIVCWLKISQFPVPSFHDSTQQPEGRTTRQLKGRVSRFGACASDDLSAVKIIVFRPITSAFTTLAGYGSKLL